MKCFCKRAVSFLTIAAILITLFSGLFQVSAATYSYNTGTREELCTALSDAALDYYTGNYTYEKLSKLSPDTLRTTLRSLVTNGRKTVGYGGLRDYHKYTDANQGSSSKLVLFYCNGIANSAWDQGKTWNREHMWPDSLGGSAMEGDLHAMRPTDPNLNSTRGNKLYGEVTNGSAAKASSTNKNLLGGYSGNNTYEPLDFAKGDCARVVLYDYVVTASMSSVTKVFTDLDTLLSWCLLDPVDTFEMSRNDVTQEIEHCRNPFVDYPELAWILFGKEVPAGMSTPSGSASADPCTHEKTHEVVSEATCTKDGLVVTVCDACDEIIATETIAKLGHEYEMTTVAPTCSEKGYDLYTCIRCDDSYKKNYTDLVDHIDADGNYACDYCGLEMIPTCLHENTFESVYEPNCTDDGMIVVICEACGCVVDKITIEKLGHEYEITTVAPTCSAKGYDLYVCIRCEDTYKKNYTAIVDHADADGNNACDYCGKEMETQEPPVEECPCEQFTDVPEKIWYHDAVVYALKNGLMNGVGDAKFDPEGSVTRAMLVTILYRSEGQPSVEGIENPFTDLPEGKWYTNAVIWAASEGIVNGVSATSFAPDSAITREQIAAILYRYDGQKDVEGSLDSFPDSATVSKYAVKAMTWAVENGIINGISGNLAPTATATRAQLATMLMRYLEK